MNFWNQSVPQSKNPGPESFKWQDVVGAPGSFQLTLPSPGVALTSWFQTVASTQAIINVFQAGKGKEKNIFKGISQKLHIARTLMWLCGRASGVAPHAPSLWV